MVIRYLEFIGSWMLITWGCLDAGLYWIFRIWIIRLQEMDLGSFQGYESGILDWTSLVYQDLDLEDLDSF